MALDALQALQVTTNWELGVLSPRLEELVWHGPRIMAPLIGEGWANHFSPCMSLFWGPNLRLLFLSLERGRPLHAMSVTQATKLATKLKHLDIMTYAVEQGLIDEYLSSFPWPDLQYLRAGTISPSTIHHLGSLPCLTTLEMLELSGNPLPLQYSATSNFTPIVTEGTFSNLKTVKLRSAELPQITAFTQQIPPTSPVEDLHCTSVKFAPSSEAQNAVESIRLHANPSTLRSLILRDGHDEYEELAEPIGEPLELDPDAPIDISSLLAFKHLTSVQVLFKETVQVTPALIACIPLAWPGITVLNLCPEVPSTRMPLIDHTDLLELLRGCKYLLYLGVRFDATKIRDSEPDRGAPFALRGLRVGDSPILSPSRVLSFLERNMPDLAKPVRHNGVFADRSLYMQRWKKVMKSRAWPRDPDAPDSW
ncbi:hypothetical protein DFP72DRAFT_1046713 [Ephemerocybe angulata]|uniref:Uncharacterized protein n=1 Tax=Ephemerocybe angulata TaxID=980116 RepID=A0A8H6HV96_9AGAR|nr:hypothetical protein DFP72DRAFT_1046713 [Tulosesus angulatus]